MIHDKRILNGKICFASVKREYGEYFVSITYQYDSDTDTRPIDVSNAVGLDFKTTGLYMDSDGCCADMPHYYAKSQKKLFKAQRQVSRKYTSAH